jgi:hypothetical protein
VFAAAKERIRAAKQQRIDALARRSAAHPRPERSQEIDNAGSRDR